MDSEEDAVSAANMDQMDTDSVTVTLETVHISDEDTSGVEDAAASHISASGSHLTTDQVSMVTTSTGEISGGNSTNTSSAPHETVTTAESCEQTVTAEASSEATPAPRLVTVPTTAAHTPTQAVQTDNSKRESGYKTKIKKFMSSFTGMKKAKREESDSDSEEEMMEAMHRYGRPIPPRVMKELEQQGMHPRMIQELIYNGHPAMVMGLLRHARQEAVSKNQFTEPINASGKWMEPIGLGYDKPEKEWTSPEPVEAPRPVDSREVKNSEGATVWKVDDMVRVRRLFCLGTEKGTFYKNQLELTVENTQAVSRLLDAKRGEDLVKEIVEFSNGRAAKLNSLLFVLAMCARQSDHLATKRAAYKALSSVCRIPTHLFIFMEYYNNLGRKTDSEVARGWGRAHRFGIANWYHSFKDNPFKLALHVTKYRQRNGWSHRDVIRLSHPKPSSDRGSPGLACVLKYVVKGLDPAKDSFLTDEADYGMKKILTFLEATEEAKTLTPADAEKACELIERHRLVREHLPTELLNSVPVWRALLQNMPMTALIRNLGKMSKIGLLDQGSTEATLAIGKLTNPDQLKGARIHPLNVLLARYQYNQGKGDKGNLTWTPNPDIVEALEKAFYLSFKYVEPTNKRFCIAIDISGSMDYNCTNGSPLKSREAAAAMAMVTARTERRHSMIGFHHNMIPLKITPEMNLTEVIEETKKYGFGGTDCAKPMTWAIEYQMLYDVFILYTDSETHSAYIKPNEAIKNYRRESGIHDARLIVVAMTSNGFSIADSDDPYMLDVVGFDGDAPEIMNNFIMGKI